MAHSPDDRLSAYRAKRAVDRTPEPVGSVREGEGRLFVVHKHAARQLHWDLRLQMGGVLQSWAVPKGPSRNPADKRLAVKVEDHPLEYGDFEAVIPPGNYGAGAMIVWDRGTWVPVGDVDDGFAAGKLLFELRGYKLRGLWTLVKIKKSEREWLLIKERDALVDDDGAAFPQDSILSGLTVEQLRRGESPAGAMRTSLAEAGVPRRTVPVHRLRPMLAESRRRPFSSADWVYELKYDGYRLLASLEHGEAALRTRSGREVSGAFPDIARALSRLPFDRIVVDGEVVVHDAAGLPSFQRLQQRARLARPADVRRAVQDLPATLYAFDLLLVEEYDVRSLPLLRRKALLREALPTVGPLRYADHIEEQGEALFAHVQQMRLEGVVAKKADAPYREGRSSAWLKVRADASDDFVIVGYTKTGAGGRAIGALHVAAFDGGVLRYAGRVGSGFTVAGLEELHRIVGAPRLDRAPCEGAPARGAHAWVRPETVCEVRYREWPAEGHLRHPVFLRLRDDKPPAECVRRPAQAAEEEPPTAADGSAEPARHVTFSNLDKIFWPADGLTKGDLIAYYRAIAPWMVPYLRDRPLVMTRFPDGILGKSFFQKDAPAFAPDWLRTERMWSEQAEREVSLFIAEDEASLLYIANLGTIPVHIWSSRAATLERPDWCILDLDPGDAPFAHVIEVARALHRLADRIGLPNLVKTSGSTGLHVLIPLGRQYTHEQSRVLGELLARVVAAELPEIATVARVPAQRGERVYVDYLQNGHGKLLVAPFSVRPLPGAPVSMPLRWREVTASLAPGRFTIRSAVRRMHRLRDDPLRPVLEQHADLTRALGALQGLL